MLGPIQEEHYRKDICGLLLSNKQPPSPSSEMGDLALLLQQVDGFGRYLFCSMWCQPGSL